MIAYTKTETDTLLSGIGDDLALHVGDTNNPHATTAAQVGLGSVQNYGIASTAEAQAGTVTNKYVTPALVKAYAEQHACPY